MVAWIESSSGPDLLWVSRWNGQVWEPLGSGPLNRDTDESVYDIAIAMGPDQQSFVAWTENNPAYGQATLHMNRWTGSAWENLSPWGLNASGPQRAETPSLAVDSLGRPVPAWVETSAAHDRLWVRRLDPGLWDLLGGDYVSSEDENPSDPSVTIDASNRPIVAWVESVQVEFDPVPGWQDKVWVRRWTGSEWELLGSSYVSHPDEYAYEPRISARGTNQPFLAWREPAPGISDRVMVRRFDGSDWVDVGAPLDEDPDYSAESLSLGQAGASTPVVAWSEGSAGGELLWVRLWDGASWVRLGDQPLNFDTATSAEMVSLAVRNAADLTVAWIENGLVRVKRYSP